MLIMRLDSSLKQMLADRLTATELIDFLEIPVEEVIDIFEEDIINNFEEVMDLAGIVPLNEDNDNE